jgi:hypothetical protein
VPDEGEAERQWVQGAIGRTPLLLETTVCRGSAVGQQCRRGSNVVPRAVERLARVSERKPHLDEGRLGRRVGWWFLRLRVLRQPLPLRRPRPRLLPLSGGGGQWWLLNEPLLMRRRRGDEAKEHASYGGSGARAADFASSRRRGGTGRAARGAHWWRGAAGRAREGAEDA